ncbi:MAG: hypothetical protein HGB10_02050 [Coriobacteriia bacterium]|nr:hypothetical protein [Coriobacteriia bacterium]
MTRETATRALAGELSARAFGLAWLPGALLDAVARDTGAPGRADSLAAFAASVPVDLAFVAAGESYASDAVAALQAADVAAVWAVDGVLSRVSRAVGWVEALRMTVAEPEHLTARLDTARAEVLVDVGRGIACGADAVLVADELAGASGPLVAPDFVLATLMPHYHRVSNTVRQEGLPLIFHSDGDTRAFMPALAAGGFTGVHLASLDAERFVECATTARSAGLVVLGGIGVQDLAAIGSRRAGERGARAALAVGGVIVSDDGGASAERELPALAAAIEAARSVIVRDAGPRA